MKLGELDPGGPSRGRTVAIGAMNRDAGEELAAVASHRPAHDDVPCADLGRAVDAPRDAAKHMRRWIVLEVERSAARAIERSPDDLDIVEIRNPRHRVQLSAGDACR